MDKKNNKKQNLINLAISLVIIILLNVASQYLFFRADLTSEKRYTLSESTVEMLDSLDDVVYFEVYLEGDFPQGAGDYKRLRDETRIMLDEFRAWADDKIQYEFIDPGQNPDEKERKEFQKQLATKGLIPHPESFVDDNGTEVTQLLFPWAVARYHGREVAVPLMGSTSPRPNEEVLNHAVEGLEYELSNAIRKLRIIIKPTIGVTLGHGEPDTMQTADLVKGLREYYNVEYVNFGPYLNTFRDTMAEATQIRNKYKAIIMVGPESLFTQQELFIMDQYIMYGGNAMFLVDPVYASMDSLSMTGQTMGIAKQMGLEELLFRYGARLNTTLVEDLYCANVAIPVTGPQTQFIPAPWVYSPTIQPLEKHPIVKNLDRIKFDFLSTVDTIETGAPVKKTILIKTSDKSTFVRAPLRVELKWAMLDRDPRTFNKPSQPVAVLLEGQFDSYFKNKFLPQELKDSKEIGYKEKSPGSKIIVIGDGDVALNPVYQGRSLPLGLDRMNRLNRQFYANKTLLVNCVNYLCDDKGLLSVRSREVKLRMLDRGKIKDHRLKWQLINIVAPVSVILLFGFYRLMMRRRIYGQAGNAAREMKLMPWISAGVKALVLAACDYFFVQHSFVMACVTFGIVFIALVAWDKWKASRNTGNKA